MPHALAAFAHHHTGLTVAILILLYLLLHHRSYRKRRRHGLSVWASIPGPFGTRISRRF